MTCSQLDYILHQTIHVSCEVFWSGRGQALGWFTWAIARSRITDRAKVSTVEDSPSRSMNSTSKREVVCRCITRSNSNNAQTNSSAIAQWLELVPL
ncbi:hypothetical protein HC928_19560 [bacterium]|nr:hypothetical protein [bacterium]